MKRLYTCIFKIYIAFMCLSFITCNNGMGPQIKNSLNVSGQVTLETENGVVVKDKSGIIISLEGTSYSTNTDSLGNWRLNRVSNGTYNIIISKIGWVSTKYFDFNIISDTIFYSTLGQTPIFNVTNITAIFNLDTIFFSGTISNTAPYYRRVMIYFDTVSTVSNENHRFSLGTDKVLPSSSNFSFSDKGISLKLNGFPRSGMRVYMAAYGEVGGSYLINLNPNYNIVMDVSPIAARSSFLIP